VLRLVWAGVLSSGVALLVAAGGDAAAQTPAAAATTATNGSVRYDGAHPSVVRVIVPQRDGIAYGSGTLVGAEGSYGLVVTNWHVVRDASGLTMVLFPDGFRSAAKILKSDRTWDLALLAIWRPPTATPVPISPHMPPLGEPLTIAGYGPGWYRAATGRCANFVAPDERSPQQMIEVSVTARQGDSGGPILNSRGEVAGVLFGTGDGRTAGSYGGRVRQFVEAALPEFQRLGPPPPEIVRQLAPQPAAPAAAVATLGQTIAPPAGPLPGSVARADNALSGSREAAIAAATLGQPALAAPPPAAQPVAVAPPAVTPAAPPPVAVALDPKPAAPPVAVAARPVAPSPTPPPAVPAARPPVEAWAAAPAPVTPAPIEVINGFPTAPPAAVVQRASGHDASSSADADVGSGRSDQVKTILAVVGLVALVFHGLHFVTGHQSPPPKKKSGRGRK